MSEVKRILDSIEQGEPEVAEELVPLLYDELRRLAAYHLAQEKPGQTLQATALVHEAYQRLVGSERKWTGGKHFFCAAAQAMRRILTENARRKKRIRHGGDLERVDWANIELPIAIPSDNVLALGEALDRLQQIDAQAAELITLRFFSGLSQEQAAETLGISPRTADRTWAFARAWLFREIQKT